LRPLGSRPEAGKRGTAFAQEDGGKPDWISGHAARLNQLIEILPEDNDEETYRFGSDGISTGRRFGVCRSVQERERGEVVFRDDHEEEEQEASQEGQF
jgi:hypothetical protein